MTARSMLPTRRQVLGRSLSLAALTWPMSGWAGGETLTRIGGMAFGTRWSVTAPAGQRLDDTGAGIEILLRSVDRQMSPWRADSEVSRLNRAAIGSHPVSAPLAQVTEAALRTAAASDGAFDPTVGPLVGRWGFGPIEGTRTGDWRDLAVDADRLIKSRPGLTLDLCGIAKGHALDRMHDLLVASGVTSALIDLGGELRGIGQHPAGRPWQVAVDNPMSPRTPAAIVALTDLAVATSGLQHQSYRHGSRGYGHIIDPIAGTPAAGALRSVTVLGPSALSADAWATALFAAGAGTGPALARRQSLSALFLVEAPGGPRIETTGDFPGAML